MKNKRKCGDCANFAPFDCGQGLGECRFGYSTCRCFANNAACKVFLSKAAAAAPAAPREEDAPFCGDFAKCNNGEGCDCCREFEVWAQEQDIRRGVGGRFGVPVGF